MKFILPLFLFFCASKSTLAQSLSITCYQNSAGEFGFYITNYGRMDIYFPRMNELMKHFGSSIVSDSSIICLSSSIYSDEEPTLKMVRGESKVCYGFVNYPNFHYFDDVTRSYKLYYRCNDKTMYLQIKNLKIGHEQRFEIID